MNQSEVELSLHRELDAIHEALTHQLGADKRGTLLLALYVTRTVARLTAELEQRFRHTIDMETAGGVFLEMLVKHDLNEKSEFER